MILLCVYRYDLAIHAENSACIARTPTLQGTCAVIFLIRLYIFINIMEQRYPLSCMILLCMCRDRECVAVCCSVLQCVA